LSCCDIRVPQMRRSRKMNIFANLRVFSQNVAASLLFFSRTPPSDASLAQLDMYTIPPLSIHPASVHWSRVLSRFEGLGYGMNRTVVDTPSAGALLQIIRIKGQRTANCSSKSGTWEYPRFPKMGIHPYQRPKMGIDLYCTEVAGSHLTL